MSVVLPCTCTCSVDEAGSEGDVGGDRAPSGLPGAADGPRSSGRQSFTGGTEQTGTYHLVSVNLYPKR